RAPAGARVTSSVRGAPVPQGSPAGLVSRTAAGVVDGIVVLCAVFALHFGYAAGHYLLLGPPFSLPDPAAWLTVVLGYAAAVAYLAGGWLIGGRTVGDQVLGLRVLSRSRRQLTVAAALLRAVLCVFLPWGLLWIPVDRRGASVQDRLVNTAVVHDWYGRSRPGGDG
uniref:RDD family protein n=1 Tax=Streptomyces sp. CRN 30 TaxID=3075613 RepID=UPI002A816FCC